MGLRAYTDAGEWEGGEVVEGGVTKFELRLLSFVAAQKSPINGTMVQLSLFYFIYILDHNCRLRLEKQGQSGLVRFKGKRSFLS